MKRTKYVKLFEDLDNDQEMEETDDYQHLVKVGLVPPAINVTIEKGYFSDDSGENYDEISLEYAKELEDWRGPDNIRVIKATVVLHADGDNYYTSGSSDFDVLFSDKAKLIMHSIVERSSITILEFTCMKDGRTVDLKEGLNDDPVTTDDGELEITQPLNNMIQYSGFYSW